MKKLITAALALSLALAPAAGLADENDVRVYLDGKRLTLTDANGDIVAPVIIDGSTYLPLRAIAGALGLDVDWDAASSSVYLSTDGNGGGEGDKDDNATIIATDRSVFSSLGYYADRPYELLGTSAFLDPLKELMGADYEAQLLPLLSTCYAAGGDEMLTLYCSVDGNNRAAIDVYPSGRIDAAILTAVVASSDESDNGYRNVVKYYSDVSPDAVNSSGILGLIADNAASYRAIEFRKGSAAPTVKKSTYNDVNGCGSFTFTPNDDGRIAFSGGIENSPLGGCTSSGTLSLRHGCAVCFENGAPSIYFAFSGDSLTVIGLNDVTRPLTTVFKK